MVPGRPGMPSAFIASDQRVELTWPRVDRADNYILLCIRVHENGDDEDNKECSGALPSTAGGYETPYKLPHSVLEGGSLYKFEVMPERAYTKTLGLD